MNKQTPIYFVPFPKKNLRSQIILSLLCFVSLLLFDFNNQLAFYLLILLIILSNWIHSMWVFHSFFLFTDRIEMKHPARFFSPNSTYKLLDISKIEIKTSNSVRAYPQFKLIYKNGRKINHDFLYDSKEPIQNLIDNLRSQGVSIEVFSKGKIIFT